MEREQPAGTRVETTAELTLLALEAVIVTEGPDATEAERYDNRIRFALSRVGDLRRASAIYGGVFEAARLDVALSILEGHTEHARVFVERLVEPAEPAESAPRRSSRDIITKLQAAPEIDEDASEPRAA
jgi:hypothetical protein